MSVQEDARVLIFVADYAGADAAGKINAIGAAFNLTGLQQQGMTPPQHLVVMVDVPQRYVGSEYSFSVELRRDDRNQVVTFMGASGQPEALRIQQTVRPGPVQVPPGAQMPADVYTRTQFVFAFPTGLQLEAGVTYRWRVEIDGQTRPTWNAVFHVLAPISGPVLGGPSAPAPTDFPKFEA